MSSLENHPRLDALRARCAPYLVRLIERAAELALEIHAESVSIEHLLASAMRDEDSAANQAVVFAFADPETVLSEILALCPGILIVGTASTRAFSPGAVQALASSRASAERAGRLEVELGDLVLAAASMLPEAIRARLEGLGWRSEPPSAGGDALTTSACRLGEQAKLALSRAARAAVGAGEATIGPARIFVAGLQLDPHLAAQMGVDGSRARLACEGAYLDTSRPRPRRLPPDAGLLGFLERLHPGAGSLELLRACHDPATSELRELFSRHKLGLGLLDRVQGKLCDPE